MTADTAAAAADLALYLEGLAAFDRGDYFESHELLEDLWLRNRSELRPFLQGLIQLAAAHHHLTLGRYVGAMALFDAGPWRLRPFAPSTLGLDVARLLLESEACRVHAEGLGPERLGEFDWTLRARAGVEPPTLEAFWPHRGVAPHPLSDALVAGR